MQSPGVVLVNDKKPASGPGFSGDIVFARGLTGLLEVTLAPILFEAIRHLWLTQLVIACGQLLLF
jgi:hypothetical protein